MQTRRIIRWRTIGHRSLAVTAPAMLIAALFFGWEWVARNTDSVIPTAGSIAAELADNPDVYWTEALFTVTTALIGLFIGVAVAIALAVVVVHIPILNAAVMPVAVLVHATPVVAIAPALVVAFGFGRTPDLIVTALITFFPMFINVIAGLKSVPEDMLEVFTSMAATKLDVFLKLRVPSSITYFFAAAKTCTTLAMIGAVVAELASATNGLGSLIVQATTYLNLPQMWAAIGCSAVISLGLLGIISALERILVRW